MTDILLALPEMVLAVAAMALLLIGAFRGDKSAHAVTGASAVAMLAVAALTVVENVDGFIFHGMFAVDDFRRFVKVVVLVTGAGCLALAPSFWEKNGETYKPEYSVLVMLAALGMMLMVGANDWIALYVALELQNIVLYILATLRREEKRSSEAGLKYYMLSAFSSAILLFGLTLVYGVSGGTGFGDTASALAELKWASSLGLAAGLVFILSGFALKIAAAPFHMWSPDVYEGAPTPVVAFMAAVPKTAAVALLAIILVVPFVGMAHIWQPLVMVLAVLSMVIGAFAGLMQTNIKRLMAYSAIMNIGTVLVGLVCLNPANGKISVDGLQGALLYLALYAFGVIGVFGTMLVLRKEGKPLESLSDFAGLSQAHPALALAMAASLFSLAGVPPLAGFFGKYFVLLAAIRVDLWPLVLLGVLASVVAAAYYLRIVKIMYFDAAQGVPFDPVNDKALKGVILVAVLSVIVFVLAPAPLLDVARQAAESLLVP